MARKVNGVKKQPPAPIEGIGDILPANVKTIMESAKVEFHPLWDKVQATALKLLPYPEEKIVDHTPAAEWAAKEKKAKDNLKHWRTLLLLTQLEALIPFTSIGDVADEIFRLPEYQALGNTDTDILSAEYFMGEQPILQRYWRNQLRPFLPSADQLADMRARDYITWKTYLGAIGESGFTHDWGVHLTEIKRRYPDLETMLALYRRNIITDKNFGDWSKYSGVPEWVYKQLIKLEEQYPEPYRLADMAAKTVIPVSEYKKAMRVFGLDDVWSTAWLNAQQTRPTPAEIMQLWRRNLTTEDGYFNLMRYSGYAPSITMALAGLKEVIPPLTDLIHMAVREAFGDHTYEKQYPEYEKYAEMMGLSKYFAGAYWYAHWERIPLLQMYDNLYRGFWDKDEFMRMLRIKDVHPDDREALFKVAFRPPSIREMGYGYDMGVYSRDDILRYRMWGGLSSEDAEKAADSLIRYRTSAEIEAVRREYLYAFARERITYEEYANALLELETPEEALPFWLQRGELLLERYQKPTQDIEGRIISSSEAKWAFKNGLRDEAWLRTALSNLDWTEDRIKLTVERLKLEMLPEDEVPAEVKYKRLSLTQLEKLYDLGELTDDELKAGITALDYTEESTALIYKLITVQMDISPRTKPFTSATANGLYDLTVFDEDDLFFAYREMGYDEYHAWLNVIYTRFRLEYPYLRALYEKGAVTSEAFKTELMKMGLTEYQAKTLTDKTVKELQITRLTKERDLTKSEIIKGVKNRLITFKDGTYLLMDLGYEEWEAQYILELNKVVAAGDPEGYWDMKRVTEAYKKARGLKSKDIPEELVELETKVNVLKKEIEILKKKEGEEEQVAEKTVLLGSFEQRMRHLLKQHSLV